MQNCNVFSSYYILSLLTRGTKQQELGFCFVNMTSDLHFGHTYAYTTV